MSARAQLEEQLSGLAFAIQQVRDKIRRLREEARSRPEDYETTARWLGPPLKPIKQQPSDK